MKKSKPVLERGIKIYRKLFISTMERIESITHTPFCDIDSNLEEAFWIASDSDNLYGIRKAYRLLCEIHDNLTMDK